MNSNEFLNNLLFKISDNEEGIENIGFGKINNSLFESLDSIQSKKVICLSSSYFHENLYKIASINNKQFFEVIISLPIFKDDDNLLILIFNPYKLNNKCLFIDESDSLLHKNDLVDWKYAEEELITKILKSYNDFSENENSVILDIHQIFANFSKRKLNDDFLSLKSNSDEISTKKYRVISNEIADEILSLKEKQSVRDEISKHNVKSNELSQSNTLYFLNDAMYYKKRQNPENLLYKNNERLIDGNVPFRKLGKITDLQNIYFKNDKDTLLIATCKHCDSKLVFYNEEITDFEGEVYIELSKFDESISKEYLYEYLSSSNGLDELLYFSKGNNYINPEDIKNVKIPIPSFEIQKEIVKVTRESREFFKTVDLLKKEFNSNILDYKHMKTSLNQLKGDISFDKETNDITSLSRSWRHAYAGLIWPLAISYLSATKGGFESVEKKDNYLVLFEFISAFNSIILLSGLPDDVYQKNFDKIWNARNPYQYKKMTFGNWIYLAKNLADIYNHNNFSSQLDEELSEKITEDKFLNILENTKKIRNENAHGAYANSYEAEKTIEKLDVYLDDIFDILEIFSNYKLIYVTGVVNSVKQSYNHRVILLNGPCAQPIYDEIIFDTILQSESLYLYNPKNNKKLLLKDNLIKFLPIDKNKKRWALFVYYSCDNNEFNAYYKCFQSNEKDHKESIHSFTRDILGKLN